MSKVHSVISRSWSSAIVGVMAGMFSGSTPAFADDTAPPGHSIGYAFYNLEWAITQTEDGKAECPEGLNELGPREQYKIQFPEDGTKRKLVDTELLREADVWFPKTEPDQFHYRLAGGKTAPGLNLDGKIKPTDFTSPDGEPGIDNQLFRVIGCILNRRAGSAVQKFDDAFHRQLPINRLIIELTGVDSLVNDDDVTVTVYRGRDPLVSDATSNRFLPGGTQRIDARWGGDFIHTAKGKIVNGVLTTEPMDFIVPREIGYETAPYEWMRGARFKLKVTAEGAEGVIGGYADIETFYRCRNRVYSTHHLSYGQEASASIYRELVKAADGFPDPATGQNTAISAAYAASLVQVHILHPSEKIARK